jgi:hypothetical protein
MFCYTSWRFYVFYRTNLLTRCHSASSLFLLFLCFRKATQEIFSELDEAKARIPIFPEASRSLKMRRRGARGRPHHGMARATPGRAMTRCGPLAHTLTLPFRLYNPLDGKTLRDRSIFHETYCKPPSSTRDWEGPEALLGTLPERGITTRGLLYHHGCLRSDVWVVYLGLRVHSRS